MKNKPGNIVIWEGTDWKSMECLEWNTRTSGTIINSQLMGVMEGEPFHYKYRIETDEEWQTEYFLVHDLLNTHNKLELRSDKKGNWFDNDAALPSLQGCRDIDISLTPFTNTLPIRRLQLEKGV
ncbi:MAG TPA: putative glycolipid-binding domain-containing protein, partial [Chitinophagaceae bacterium]|nr:putative glycolipid-binding domain-containing protein [Chitinophagaceae bacterium]